MRKKEMRYMGEKKDVVKQERKEKFKERKRIQLLKRAPEKEEEVKWKKEVRVTDQGVNGWKLGIRVKEVLEEVPNVN